MDQEIKTQGALLTAFMARFQKQLEEPDPEREAYLAEQQRQKEECQKRLEVEQEERRLNAMRIPKRYRSLSLDDYAVTTDNQKKVVEFLRGYGNRPLDKMENLIIHGPPGTGKTHMICAFIQGRRKGEAEYWKLSDIMRTVKDGYSPKGEETELRFIKRLSRIPILAIDEIGRQGGTAFEGSFMFDLLDDRYDNLLPTILASNLPVEGNPSMTSYLGISVMDRINENSLDIPCEWGNYRDHAEAELITRTRIEG